MMSSRYANNTVVISAVTASASSGLSLSTDALMQLALAHSVTGNAGSTAVAH